MKKKALFALALAALSLASRAATEQPAQSAEMLALRAECAARHEPRFEARAPEANEYRFAYYKGQYRGEAQAGQRLDCSEGQYAAYLDTLDPTRVMAAYPTAAGRPRAKQ